MVDEVLKLQFSILGLVVPKINIPTLDQSIDKLELYKKDETLKITLLDNIKNDNYSSKELSKIQLALNINKDVIVLYDFSKGLNKKDLNYFNLLFKKITKKYNKRIILISRDIDYLVTICDRMVVYDKKIIYTTTDIYDSKLYTYIDIPPIIKFIKYANQKGIKLSKTIDINELIKDIYRRKDENKNNI